MTGYRALCLWLLAALLGITAWRQYAVEPLESEPVNTLWFALQAAPLLLVLPGLRRGTRAGYFYVVLAACLYFIHGTMEAATADQRVLALVETGCSVGLIGAACLAMRHLRG